VRGVTADSYQHREEGGGVREGKTVGKEVEVAEDIGEVLGHRGSLAVVQG